MQNRKIGFKSERPYAGQMKKAVMNQKNLVYYLFCPHDQRGDEKEYVTNRRDICKDFVSIVASLIK